MVGCLSRMGCGKWEQIILTGKTQVLRLRPEFFDDVRQGKKRSTIRAGRGNLKVGPLILQSKFDILTVELTEVIYKKFGELTQEDARADGFATLEELRKTLKQFYPNLHQNSIVTLIHFQLPTPSEK